MLNCPKIKKQLIGFFLVFLISSLGIFVLGAKEVKANYVIDGLKAVLGDILLTIQQLVGTVVAWLAGLAQGIISFTHPQKAQIVQDGWEISRDLTNMFFVLVLLTIALATILRLETYGMKALLPKLIGVALLINFSLVFAGVIIDFSGVLTNFFIEDGQEFFTNFADSMRLTKTLATTADEKGEQWQCAFEATTGGGGGGIVTLTYYSGKWSQESDCDPKCTIGEMEAIKPRGTTFKQLIGCEEIPTAASITNWDDLGDKYWATISSLFFSIIFTIIAAFVFGAFAFLLLVRVLAIWFLLILAPLAWFFWILPATKQLATQWWNNFIKWVFFAPAAIFFIWLSVNSWLKFIRGKALPLGEKIAQGMNQTITNEALASQLIPQIMEPKNFVQFILVCGMLIGSLIVAQKMGIYGAQGAVKMAKGAGKGVAKWTGKKAQTAAAPTAGKIGKGLQKTFGAIPGLRQIARPFRAFEEKERAAIGEVEKKYKGWTSDNLKSQYNAVDPQGKAAIGKILASRGELKGFEDKEVEQMLTLAKRYGQEKDILKARPDLAPLIKKPEDSDREAIEKVISGIKPADVEKMQKEALTDETMNVIYNELQKPDGKWNKDHLSKAAETNPTLRIKIKEEIIDKPNKKDFLREDVKKFVNGEVGKVIFG